MRDLHDASVVFSESALEPEAKLCDRCHEQPAYKTLSEKMRTVNVCKSCLPKPKPLVIDGYRPGRNEACPCGSGRKFKRCCLGRFL